MSFSSWWINWILVFKGSELLSHKNTWRKRKCILIGESSQSQNLLPVWFQLYDVLEKAKPWRQWKISAVARGRGRKRWLGRADGIIRAVDLVWHNNGTWMSSYICQTCRMWLWMRMSKVHQQHRTLKVGTCEYVLHFALNFAVNLKPL